MGRIVVEAAVDSLELGLAAVDLGADRLELCRALEVGGLTPDPGLVETVRARVAVPIHVMIRPRSGDFVVSAGELVVMEAELRRLATAGAGGFVLGAITEDRQLDKPTLARLLAAAGSRAVTFHRAFDELADPEGALRELAALGVSRVLTSGGAVTAFEGREAIARYGRAAPSGLSIMPGGGVRADHVVELVRSTGVSEVHLRPGPDLMRLRLVLAALGTALLRSSFASPAS